MADLISYREDARIHESRIHEREGRVGRAWTCVAIAVEPLLLTHTRPSDHTKFVGKAHEHPVSLGAAASDVANVRLMRAASRRTSSFRLTVKPSLRASSTLTNIVSLLSDSRLFHSCYLINIVLWDLASVSPSQLDAFQNTCRALLVNSAAVVVVILEISLAVIGDISAGSIVRVTAGVRKRWCGGWRFRRTPCWTFIF